MTCANGSCWMPANRSGRYVITTRGMPSTTGLAIGRTSQRPTTRMIVRWGWLHVRCRKNGRGEHSLSFGKQGRPRDSRGRAGSRALRGCGPSFGRSSRRAEMLARVDGTVGREGPAGMFLLVLLQALGHAVICKGAGQYRRRCSRTDARLATEGGATTVVRKLKVRLYTEAGGPS